MSLVARLFRPVLSSHRVLHGNRHGRGFAREALKQRSLLLVAIVAWTDFSYVGAFRLPEVANQASKFSYVDEGAVWAYNPYGDGGKGSLFIRGHAYQQMVSEVGIPRPGAWKNDPAVAAGLPTARVLQPFGNVAPGYLWNSSQGAEMNQLSGLLVTTLPGKPSPCLLWTVRHSYNVASGDYNSHGISTLDLSHPQAKGLWNIAGFPNNATAGYLAEIPAAFANQYLSGRRIITGQQGVSGDASSSWGPSAFAIKPWQDDGALPPDGAQLEAIPLVYHPAFDHPYPGWKHANFVNSVQWLQLGDRQAFVFTVTAGQGEDWYGNGADYPYLPGGDKVKTGKTFHAPPYDTELWFYSVDDIQKVVQGQIQPWEIRPCQRVNIGQYFRYARYRPGPIAYDAANQRLFLLDPEGTTDQWGSEPIPVIHVFQAKPGGAVAPIAGGRLAETRGWASGPSSLWTPAAGPAIEAVADVNAVELGVRFRSDVDGCITGIRFYKSSANTGPHTASLWSSEGARLGTATFTGETASGWQQVMFSQPVAIKANTTYVASYHTASGSYSATKHFFSITGADSGPLHAPAGGNGVFAYGAGAFPTETHHSTNYWVDVVFEPFTRPPGT
jgi:hypothetical protein